MLPPATPDLVSLDLLDSIAELGSLGQAAGRHGMSQPAVSMRMAQLERNLGLSLLRRSPAGTKLTPAGELVAALGRRVLGEVQAMMTGVAALVAEEGSHLRVAASLTVAEYLLPGWLSALHREGIRPGVVACSQHMGRWKPAGHDQAGAGGLTATVDLRRGDDGWSLRAARRVGPYASADPDTARIWWSDTGVHQNLTLPVHPDPISGMHCWHQAVTVRPAEPGDAHGDIAVDTARARRAYQRWMRQTRPAGSVSPDGTRRPRWLMRPLKPSADAFALPAAGTAAGTGGGEP